MASDSKAVIFETLSARDGVIGCITLNRPEAFNALNHAMIQDITQQLRQWLADEKVSAVLFKSASPRAFCAGGDVRDLYANRETGLNDSVQFFSDEYRLNHLIGTYTKPTIALVDGIVMGGGAGLAMHCRHRIGTENILFAMPEVGIGLFPDIGASFFLQRCPGLLGLFLALTGTRLRIADCCYARLIDYYVPSNQLVEVVQALCTSDLPIDANDTLAHLIESFSVTPDSAPLQTHQFLIDGVFSQDSVEDMLSILKRDDGQWTQVIVEHLIQKSPLSLAVTCQAMKRVQGESLSVCLQQDFILGQSFIHGHDLYEGIRAVLIDKDMKPKWQPAQLSDCTNEMVDAYFLRDAKQILNF